MRTLLIQAGSQYFYQYSMRIDKDSVFFNIQEKLSKDHAYPTCIIIGKPYKYINSLCINCKENYFTNSKVYKTLKVAKLVREEDSMEE